MTTRHVGSSLRYAFGGLISLAFIAGFIAVVAARESQLTPPLAILPISPELCEDMKVHHVLNPGAPVNCERLRLIKFGYIGFDDNLHGDGELVVMDAVAEDVLQIFGKLRATGFRVAKARLMDHYDGNDDASMADNNTSAFNVREIVGGGSTSLHAYGLAIDVNPVQNPYAKRSGATLTFNPPSGADYANRLNDRPWKDVRLGMTEAVVDLFADHGFLIWGGYWDDPIDYQHFQVSQGLAEKLARASPTQARAEFVLTVERYRKCRRAAGDAGASGRAKCVMAADTNPNGARD